MAGQEDPLSGASRLLRGLAPEGEGRGRGGALKNGGPSIDDCGMYGMTPPITSVAKLFIFTSTGCHDGIVCECLRLQMCVW